MGKRATNLTTPMVRGSGIKDLRGLTRSFSLDLAVSRSKVHTTSLAVKGLPSCHATPPRSGKVSSVPSSLHDQPVARSVTIGLQAVLRHALVEHDEVVEHAHHRPLGEDGRFLVDRHARRAVGTVRFQNAALLLGECRCSGEHCK